MDRLEFIDGLYQHNAVLSQEEKQKIISNSLAIDGNMLKSIIVMEELAELQKEISKYLRGQADEFALLEEIADVKICIDYLLRIYHFSDHLLDRAVSVKLTREKRRLDKE